MVMSRKNKDGVWAVSAEITVSRYDLEGTIDSIKASLDLIREQAVAMGMIGEGSVDISTERGYYSDDYEVVIRYYFERAETDAERVKREKLEADEKARRAKDRKAAAEKRKMKADVEYAEYERLKAKFGDN